MLWAFLYMIDFFQISPRSTWFNKHHCYLCANTQMSAVVDRDCKISKSASVTHKIWMVSLYLNGKKKTDLVFYSQKQTKIAWKKQKQGKNL